MYGKKADNDFTEKIKKVNKLKKEKDAIILAHYYVPGEVQEVADFVGDSYALAKKAVSAPEKTICFAGVNFMCESAKILNPEKIVLVPEIQADCPMAHMVKPEDIKIMREKYEDLAVVCYINSTAEIKKYSDVIVTSSNAEKIVKSLDEKNIFFIPDKNLGGYIAKQCPEKNIILNEGWCHVHSQIRGEDVQQMKEKYPGVKVLAHPECGDDVLKKADYIGSTSGIIEFARKSEDKKFLIATEIGVFHKLKKDNNDKEFIPIIGEQICEDMKMITLDKVIKCLEDMSPSLEMSKEDIDKAYAPLARMLELAR